MKKQKIYFLLDQILFEYKLKYKDASENKIIDDLKLYLPDLAKTSKIKIITTGEIEKIKQWFFVNGLSKFIDGVSKSAT